MSDFISELRSNKKRGKPIRPAARNSVKDVINIGGAHAQVFYYDVQGGRISPSSSATIIEEAMLIIKLNPMERKTPAEHAVAAFIVARRPTRVTTAAVLFNVMAVGGVVSS